MLDFMTIFPKPTKQGVEIVPKFIMKKSKDLMVRGGDFYAIWDEDAKMWSTDEDDVIRLIDSELNKYVKENEDKLGPDPIVKYMWDSDSGTIDKWHKYVQKQKRDSFAMLDEELIFSNTELTREKHASKKLDYPLEPGSITAYDKLIGTLYSPEERHKIEWAIGSIVSGDSKTIQKFLVFYGKAGTGKSTILNIIEQLFKGYIAYFDAKVLGSANASFAFEPFTTNPLVAIQHDGDLSRIEDNTRLNSVVSHEIQPINEKFKKSYPMCFKAFLFMGTNKPVKITDGKSGLLRRLIDVHPSGNKVSVREYKTLTKQIKFELGAIAHHCLEVYQRDPEFYDDYVPMQMMEATNDFYNFVMDSYRIFNKEDGTTLKAAWEMYKTYCEEAKVPYPSSRKNFQEELKNYFESFTPEFTSEDGTIIRNYYSGFLESRKGKKKKKELDPPKPVASWIDFKEQPSIFDEEYSDCPAQYTSVEGTPKWKWENVKTKLSNITTSEIHYVKVPENHIVIDFDIKDEKGEKSFEKNLEEASKWPATYAELSKSGGGIHLHYIYTGEDVTKLSRVYDDEIEVKVFSGNSSLRRKLTKCNDLPIASISSGLPLKEGGKTVINFDGIKNEKALRTLIKRHLNKEIMGATKPSIDMIYKILEEQYESGVAYDVSDMRNAIVAFAASSTNQANMCLKIVNNMKFKSEDISETKNESNEDLLVFYDVEVFPNLFLVNWKVQGEDKPVVRLINPKPSDIEELLRFKLVGFNCRRYDNHILYGALNGYSNQQLYELSQKIINSDRNAFFGGAYNLSYTDVYDFSSKKQSLKKWEIELGIHHQELGLPWDEPVDESLWYQVAEYCDNDVIATEKVFEARKADFLARQILADLAGGTVNDTTNSLTTKIIFGYNRKPQSQFNYRNLAEPVKELDEETIEFLKEIAPEMMTKPHGKDNSLLPYFPGYKYEKGISTYRGEEVGEGGYVYAEPGMHTNVALLDVASMHPHSTMMEVLFGVEFTRRFKEIVYGRVHIKHEAWEIVNTMLDGKLASYIQKVLNGELTSKDLANALKIAINSVYGLTAANFDNPFRDVRNRDNIVAKRGALFMIDLKYAVQERGFTVAHVKTDSIKIPDATPEIIQFVMDFGKRYGYTFEHEATYEKMCLVNNAVYIAKYKDGDWTATGKQFAVPYVYKKLFSKEDITIDDMRETFSVKSALYLDMNETLPDVTMYEKEFEKLEDKYKKGKISDTIFESECSRLNTIIESGHDYRFVGKVGEFCPVKPGCGGGVLCREQNGKYYAATGTTGYRWLETEYIMLKLNETTSVIDEENDDIIDRSYYQKLVDDAAESISQYCDLEWFISDDPVPPVKPDLYNFMNIPEDVDEELPWN